MKITDEQRTEMRMNNVTFSQLYRWIEDSRQMQEFLDLDLEAGLYALYKAFDRELAEKIRLYS